MQNKLEIEIKNRAD